MAAAKYDGVIEAVRYAPNGQIALVRAYERRGTIWSDRILLDRNELVRRLEQGQRFVTGQRKVYLGGMFDTDQSVFFLHGTVVTHGQAPDQDHLSRVPIF